MPASINEGISLLSAWALRRSDTVTWAPRRRKNRAAARPDLPRPTTSTFFDFSSMWGSMSLTQFQGRECKECKHQCRNTKARNYFRLRPTHQLEMMMQRSHFKDTLFAQFIAAYLEYDADRLDHENAPNERQQHPLLDRHSHGADRPPQSKRANIAHEHFGRV